jgi:hypothetical protein
MFRILDLFTSSGEGEETQTFLVPLERSHLNHFVILSSISEMIRSLQSSYRGIHRTDWMDPELCGLLNAIDDMMRELYCTYRDSNPECRRPSSLQPVAIPTAPSSSFDPVANDSNR